MDPCGGLAAPAGEQGRGGCALRGAGGAAHAVLEHWLLTPPSQVYEETGFDVTDKIVEGDFVETVHSQNRTKLYIVADVDEQVRFPLSSASASDIRLQDRVCASDTKGDQQHSVALDRRPARRIVRGTFHYSSALTERNPHPGCLPTAS